MTAAEIASCRRAETFAARLDKLGYAWYADASGSPWRGVAWPDPMRECSGAFPVDWLARANGPRASGFMGARGKIAVLRRLVSWAESRMEAARAETGKTAGVALRPS